MSQEGGQSKIVAPTLDKDLSTSSVPDASDLSSLDTQGEDQDIALVEVQGPHPIPVLSESSQPAVPGQEVEESDPQPETSANLPPDPLPKERPQRSVRPNPEHVQEHGPLRVSSYTKTAGDLSIFLNQATQELDRGLSSPIRTDELFIELEAHYQDLVERFRAVRELRLDLEYQASYESLVDRCNSVGRQLRSVNPPTSTSRQQDDFKHAVLASVKHEPQDTHAESPNAQLMPHTASTSSVKAVQLIGQRQIDEIKRSVKSSAKGHRSQKSGSRSARSSSSTSLKKLIKRSEAAALKLRQQAMPNLEQHEKAELDMQRKIEEEEMLLRAELDHLEAQQKADKAQAEAQRKVEEAQEEAQGKAEEFKLRIEKTRKLNEMKDRLARIKTEKEHAKLQVDIKAAEVAAAILEAGSEVDDASMVLSSLAPLNRTRDLYLNRTDEVSSQPSNAVGTAQATSQPSASRIHKDHLKLTSHPLRYSNPAPNLHSQANMSIGPCQQLLFPKYITSRVVDSIFDNTGEREEKAQLEPAVAFPGTKKSATPYGVGKTTHAVSESVNPTLAGDPQQYNGTTHYHGSPPYGYRDSAQCDQHLSAQAPPFVPTNSNIYYSDQQATEEQSIVKSLAEALSLSRLPIPRPTVFKGDPLAYPAWIAAFNHLVRSDAITPEDKMLILREHIDGPAKQAVGDLYYELSKASYLRALEILESRFGEDYSIAESLKSKLESWPEVKPNDCAALTNFADYLRQCQAMSKKINGLGILNDPSYINKLILKIPRPLAHAWSRKVEKSKRETRLYPSFETFVDFLHFESNALQHVPFLRPRKPGNPDTPIDKAGRSNKTFLTNSGPGADQSEIASLEDETNAGEPPSQTGKRNPTCLFCKNAHYVPECKKFADIPYMKRKEFVMKQRLCFKCLRPFHRARDCKKTVTCNECKGNHVTSMHDPDFKPRSKQPPGNDQQPEQNVSTNVNSAASVGQQGVESNASTKTVLKTEHLKEQPVAARLYSLYIPVYVSARSNPEREELVYAMLDTMSDTSFVLGTVAEKLDLDKREAFLTLSTLTTTKQTTRCFAFSNLRVRAYNAKDFIDIPTAYSQEEICVDKGQIPTCENVKNISHLSHLSDQFQPLLNVHIGLLLGVNVSEALRPLQIEYGKPGLPFAQRTRLGWSILGEMPVNHSNNEHDPVAQVLRVKKEETDRSLLPHGSMGFRTKDATNEQLIKMMEQDFTCPNEQPLSQEDHRFMKILTENIKINDDGHYELPLPFKQDEPRLPNNRHVALRRLMSLKRRFQKDDIHFQLYKTFVQEMIERGDAEIIPNDEPQRNSTWYIPHHGVYNPNKPGKVRVVFDCAARCQGTCLNDHLLTGPDLMNSLIGVLCRFRLKPVAISCDVKRMFHQFHVAPQHRDYLRFLWWPDNDLNAEPKDYRMKVHLFRAASSPGCANFSLKQLARANAHLNPQASEFIQRDFYVDDGLHSSDNVPEAIQVLEGARQICRKGNLRLHKLASSDPKVLTSFPPSEVVQSAHVAKDLVKKESSMERALGVRWTLETDSLHFFSNPNKKPLTKRGILSTVASIFDPLGLISPITLKGRMILQEACRSDLGWDQTLPARLVERWSEWLCDIGALSTICIPRYYFSGSVLPWHLVEFHHFADASTVGYGECSYLRILDDKGKPYCAVVMAKSKVAPIRPVTVPRLELQAAVLSVKIAQFLQEEFEGLNAQHHFWSDSKIVLGYLYNKTKKFHTFVANRVQQILDFSEPQQWHYVPSKDNPADHASRGLSVTEMKDSNWHSGPEFLKHDPVVYEVPEVAVTSDDTEVKVYPTKVKDEKGGDCEEIIKRFSSLDRLLRVAARLLSWLRQARKKRTKQEILVPSSSESQDLAFKQIIIGVQAQHFPLSQRSTHHELRRLDVFTDHQGILRVGGRLRHSSEAYQVKHPIVLPKDSHLSLLMARHHHAKVAHLGRTTTMGSLLSNGIWICGARKGVSSVIHWCIHCARLRGRPCSQKMADLPTDRIEAIPPFTNTGLDCFGPFEVKDGRKNVKRYGLILTCLASRAVHLQVLEDLSTDAFICGLRRFIAIRGNVKLIRCDRGTNFVGADKELRQAFREMDKIKVTKEMLQRTCVFSFNPPSASHFGGVWERLIRTVRQVLSGLLCNHSEKLSTVTLATLLQDEKGGDCEEIIKRFSSLDRLLRVAARLLSWLRQARKKRTKQEILVPSSSESQDLAFKQIIIGVQAQHFPLSQRSTHHELRRLDVFTDHQGILRVGGRLRHSSEAYQVKHPIVLPKDSHLSLLMARHHHAKVAHLGRTTTMGSLLSNGIWICGARKGVSSVIHWCIHCARLRGRPCSQKMADLPTDRIEAIPPFTNTGLDCFGPFEVKDGRKNVKRYGLILTCLASRAVHLQVLEDLSTDAFICGLRRFIAIRGNVKLIRCDRGTNFVGADKELRQAFREMDKIKVTKEMLQRTCVFSFNPPSASHFGGVWERLIRTVRQVLSGLLCNHSEKLSTVTLATLLHEVAAIINNRPLCVGDLEDPTSLDPLTPNHLLTLKPEPVFPPPGEFRSQDMYSQKRWRRVQFLVEQFWSRWKGEYLASLQPRRKWCHQRDSLKENAVVMLVDESAPRGSWRLARVVRVYPGHDGLARSVQIRLATTDRDRKGKLTVRSTLVDRPIHKLVPLPVCDN
ncbi:hypothetical protein ACOMHN_010916 [Nucella lapillus]